MHSTSRKIVIALDGGGHVTSVAVLIHTLLGNTIDRHTFVADLIAGLSAPSSRWASTFIMRASITVSRWNAPRSSLK